VEQHGWSRGGISLAYTLQFLVGIPVVLIVGRMAERFGTRRLVITAAAVFTAGMLLTATVTSMWQFHLYFGVLVGGLGSAPFTVLLPVLLSRWFNRRLGLVMGLMWVSTSIGPAVVSPLMSRSIEAAGWAQTFTVFGIVGGVLMLGSCFLLRDDPKDMGLTPYGGSPPAPTPEQVHSLPETLSLQQVTRSRSFLALTAVHALGCIGHSIPLAHVVSIATFAGISSVAAAGVLSTLVATSAFSRFGMSLVAEKRGARFTLVIAVLLQTFPTLLLLGAGSPLPFYSFGLLFGLGFGGEMVGFPIFNRQYYGMHARLNTIYSYQLAGAMAGMAIGGWLGGALFDWTGAYTWSILAAAGAGFIGLAFAWTLPSRLQRT
jgi:MFS family permease